MTWSSIIRSARAPLLALPLRRTEVATLPLGDPLRSVSRTYAFVDESGNSDLDTTKGGSSGFFIVCSILVAEKDLDAAYAQAEELRKRHFQTGEIKSSKLKLKDSDRRAWILNELAELPFKLYFTVVDKSRIHKDGGLRIKTSFIKYVNGLLYERLFRAYPDLQMIVDEHGGQEFHDEGYALAIQIRRP